jgi:hypothetical protein|tara:strand:+ start:266 stop:1186 length:921 start_codon:yes stop_codon:yes gene_type:complete
MDNIFLDDDVEMNENNYVNENNIIDRDNNLAQCENNEQGLYDIDKLIVKDVHRENILLSSNDTEDISYDSKTLRFNLNNNKAGGIQYKKNVIGFRLNECIYTSPVYNVTEANRTITLSIAAPAEVTDSSLQIEIGNYTIYTLQNAINSLSTPLEMTYNTQQQKYFIQNTGIKRVTVNLTGGANKLLRDCGFLKDLILGQKGIDEPADTHPSLNIGTYIDIVVDEIPYKACKQNPQGFNIVHRLPIRSDSGSSIVYYKSNFIDHNFQHLFYPLNLSTLTIHLYMDGNELTLENLTISFEFELVILNK